MDRLTLLQSATAEEGDRIRLKTKGLHNTQGWDLEGILMPHHEFSGDNVITVKLDNGYNVGIDVSDGAELEIVEKAKDPPGREASEWETDTTLDKITIISTGGTIASYVDYRTGAVNPALTAEDLVFNYPELNSMCQVDARILMSRLSEDIRPEDWMTMANEVVAAFKSGSKGVIIAHGTDTLGYTAAALSFVLDVPGPVVLVGSQRSSDRPSSDAAHNLLSATRFALEGTPGVYVVMHGETGDGPCDVMVGTKVRKMHSSRRDAFRAINSMPIATVTKDALTWIDKPNTASAEPKVIGSFEPAVDIVYAHPALDPERLKANLAGLKGCIIAGTGLGHLGTQHLKVIEDSIASGTFFCMTTQCIHGRVNMNVYSSGRDLEAIGVIPLEDMLTETALVKLMWALTSSTGTKEIMTTGLKGELAKRTLPASYPDKGAGGED